jgi:hypothetical protein
VVGRRRWQGEFAPGWPALETRIPKRKPLHEPKVSACEGQACSIPGCAEPAAVQVGASFGVPYCSGHDPTRE